MILWLIRLVDRTAYRCLGCRRIRRGIAARICSGWACSESCLRVANEKCGGMLCTIRPDARKTT